MENWNSFLDVVVGWSFLPIGVAIVLLVTAGTGLWRSQWKRGTWLVGLILLGLALYVGLQRHEWGEVLFNGQLL